MKYLASLFFVLIAAFAGAQTHPYNPNVDVQHYFFKLAVNDSNDTLSGTAVITVKYLKASDNLVLDLTKTGSNGKGMEVLFVKDNTKDLKYKHENDKLNIQLGATATAGQTAVYYVRYKGIPTDGLIISKNKHGNRTMFSDDWPNRGHNWIPVVDHISDKASVEFEVTAPNHYQVVSNGIQIEETSLPNNLKLTHWKETTPIPVKVIALGIADFAVGYAGDAAGIPVTSWVFPEDREAGFKDYSEAVEILPWFVKNVGPYSYKKLANVQSKTIFGGMENAGAIFYFEGSVTGKHAIGSLLAHEIAHQWFGNTVTEIDWPHLWLSEGFATYMTNLYLEGKYGRDTLNKMLTTQRKEVIDFSKKHNAPVVDNTTTNYMELLNANSYQKGGWVLHMLRRKVGDALFWKGIQAYYKAFAGKNASTEDFRTVMEQVTKQDLKAFFKQWIYTAGQPKLDVAWKYNEAKSTVEITIVQKGPVFSFPLEIGFNNTIQTVNIKGAVSNFSFPLKSKTTKVAIDPNVNLLFEVALKN